MLIKVILEIAGGNFFKARNTPHMLHHNILLIAHFGEFSGKRKFLLSDCGFFKT